MIQEIINASILNIELFFNDDCWQDPLRGGRDKMLEEIASVIHSEDPDTSANHLVVPVARRLVPEFMLKLAGRVSPF